MQLVTGVHSVGLHSVGLRVQAAHTERALGWPGAAACAWSLAQEVTQLMGIHERPHV